ncbi:hypothetical protein [Bacillus sp. FJAT-49736]|nr:hypothetical protein [Bacillus sp. FJAT-49736]MBS4174588.1 hypothetical protein [Bacillus sp. FJAT-49736]
MSTRLLTSKKATLLKVLFLNLIAFANENPSNDLTIGNARITILRKDAPS